MHLQNRVFCLSVYVIFSLQWVLITYSILELLSLFLNLHVREQDLCEYSFTGSEQPVFCVLTKSALTKKEFRDYADDLCNHDLSNKSNWVNCVFMSILIIKGSMSFATRLYKTKEAGFVPFSLKLEFVICSINYISTDMAGIYLKNHLSSLDFCLIYR